MPIWFLSFVFTNCLLIVGSESWLKKYQPWTLGNCYEKRQGNVDRSDTVITMVVNDWMSHQLVTLIAAIVLREFLGYDVHLFAYDDYSKAYDQDTGWQLPLEWDVDLENWHVMEEEFEGAMLKRPQHLVDTGVLDRPKPIGYTGRAGLYVLTESLDSMMSDYYKAYSLPGFARSKGFLGPDPTALRATYSEVGDEFPDCYDFDFCGKAEDEYGGYYVPPWCAENMSACVEVWMGPQSQDTGYFEQLAKNNGPLYMVFAFHSFKALMERRSMLAKHPQNVVFYSWFPNWGADGQGAVRISFPDNYNGCMDGQTPNPDGSIDCDSPELDLMKVIVASLQNRAPEAFFFLRQFKMTREKLYGLFNTVRPEESMEGLFQVACNTVKYDLTFTSIARDPLWSCALRASESPLDAKMTFHPELGICTPASNPRTFQCFENPPASQGLPQHIARKGINIKIADKNWVSHHLMQAIVGILLTEQLGYSVSYEVADNLEQDEWGLLLESGIADVEPECWRAGPADPNVKLYVEDKEVVLPPRTMGWSSRLGLYVTPGALIENPFSDFYTFFKGRRARDAGFSIINKSDLVDTSQLAWTRNTSGYYAPAVCKQDPDSCIEIVMSDPDWEATTYAQVTQLVRNHKLNVIFAWYGNPGGYQRVMELAQAGKHVLFYSWSLDPLIARLGALRGNKGRVSFPDWSMDCEDEQTVGDPFGVKECDLVMRQPRKLMASRLNVVAPEAVYLINNLEISNEQVKSLYAHLYERGTNRTIEDVACWLLKTQPEIVEKAAPSCITSPKSNDQVHVGDKIWNVRLQACPAMSCERMERIAFLPVPGWPIEANQTEPTCAICSTPESPGLVPTPNQLGCEGCPAGQESVDGTNCGDCPIGRYTEEDGMTACKECAEGMYNPLLRQTFCAVCPVGGECKKGSTVFTAAKGFYIIGVEEGLYDIIRKEYAEWRNTADYKPAEPRGFNAIGPFNCPAREACQGDNRCLEVDGRPAMEGPLCGACVKGFTRWDTDDVCSECPPPEQNWVVFWLGTLVFTIVVIVFDRRHAANIGNLRETNGVVLKILMNFFILLSVVSVNCNVKPLL